jgi:hypothetical protein
MLSRLLMIVVAPNKLNLSTTSRESPDDHYSAIFTTTFP